MILARKMLSPGRIGHHPVERAISEDVGGLRRKQALISLKNLEVLHA
jgi:hypothetical protein